MKKETMQTNDLKKVYIAVSVFVYKVEINKRASCFRKVPK